MSVIRAEMQRQIILSLHDGTSAGNPCRDWFLMHRRETDGNGNDCQRQEL